MKWYILLVALLCAACAGGAKPKSEYDQVIAELTEAIRLEPDNPGHYQGRGEAYYRKKDYDQAIADYTEAIRLKPDDWGYYNARGEAYYGKKEIRVYDYVDEKVPVLFRMYGRRLKGYQALGFLVLEPSTD